MVLDDKRPPSPSVASAASVGESDVNKKRPRPLSGLRSGMSATMMTDDCEKRKKVFVELFSEDDIIIPEPPAKVCATSFLLDQKHNEDWTCDCREKS